MLDLFEHNQVAYRSVVALMKSSGKAAVIHPTGTGKSIIAFKLIEDHPDKRFIWLSPSNYIVQTQRENVRRIDPNFSDDNVFYCTYARLMYMDSDEVCSLRPDYIILDEFHRCGAAEWGKGVDFLRRQYPSVPVLGLSATSIRYLDHQRDMAAELFDGNVASEISVAEAIATGILPSPTYVIALYAYQKELERYERRVNSVRYRNNYDENMKYLEALRRALDMSVGLDQVFKKHMTNKSGKYILFCSSREHMDSVIEQIPEWFSGVDRTPHVYTVYSEDSGSEQAFEQFKSDNSGHLKLLLCIDMLSEGIHVEDISGVILLRPTTSPIVYKQQIGRALAAGKGTSPLIFDVVNNFDNLISVSWMQDEIQDIVTSFQSCGMGDKIVEDAFRVVDEVRDCRRLIQQLEESLSATWDVNYQEAKRYYKTVGNLNVPATYRTETGIQLGAWINNQRRLYYGKFHGSLTEERIDKLNRIGMIWESRYESSWENNFLIAEEYYIQNGDLKVPRTFVTEDGVLLGKWLYRQVNNREKLSQEKIERLNSIGMVWKSNWELRFETARDYIRSNPDYELSQATVIGDFWVGKWLVQQLRGLERGTLSQSQAEKMRELVEETGLNGKTQAQKRWLLQYQKAQSLIEQNGDWKGWSVSSETKPILRWIKGQQKKLETSQLSEFEVQKLRSIGVVKEKQDDPWLNYYRLAERYYIRNGNLDLPASYVTADGVRLGSWICRQRVLYRGNNNGKGLTDKQIQMLENIGMEWNPYRKAFESGLVAAERYYKSNGNLNVPARYVDEKGYPLYQWLCDTRKKKAKLREEDIMRLDSLQFVWGKQSKDHDLRT